MLGTFLRNHGMRRGAECAEGLASNTNKYVKLLYEGSGLGLTEEMMACANDG